MEISFRRGTMYEVIIHLYVTRSHLHSPFDSTIPGRQTTVILNQLIYFHGKYRPHLEKDERFSLPRGSTSIQMGETKQLSKQNDSDHGCSLQLQLQLQLQLELQLQLASSDLIAPPDRNCQTKQTTR